MCLEDTTACQRRTPRVPTLERRCEVCAASFRAWPYSVARGQGRFCSIACSDEAKRLASQIACETCGKTTASRGGTATRRRKRFCSRRCSAASRVADLRSRLARDTNRTDSSGCWLWTGRISHGGYGVLDYKGKATTAHRAAWTVASGQDVEPGQPVLHTCDNRRCVRNDDVGVYVLDGVAHQRYGHLWEGTQEANINDMVSKQRGAIGERVGRSKLTADQVRDIRSRYASGNVSFAALGLEYSVSSHTVQMIAKRRIWRHVE